MANTPRTQLPGHAAPAAGFDQPFDLLDACHDRLRQRLALSRRLQAHVQSQGVDAQAEAAAADIVRYFDLAAPHHHEDEERHLLPAIRLAASEGRLNPLAPPGLADRVVSEHAALRGAWAVLRAVLQDLRQADPARLSQAIKQFEALNIAHLQLEDEHLYPLARGLLGQDCWPTMGAEMARRRGAPAAR